MASFISNPRAKTFIEETLFVLNITKNIIGSFVLFLPWCFDQSGLAIGLSQLLLICLLCIFSFCLIALTGKLSKVNTYSNMFLYVGSWAVALVDVCIICMNILSNAGYLIFMKLRISKVIYNHTNYKFPEWALVLIFGTLLFLICLIKKLDSLRILSAFALMGILFTIIGVIILKFTNDSKKTVVIRQIPTLYGFFFTFPIYAGNFDCHTNALSFYLSFEEKFPGKSFTRFCVLVTISFFFVMVVTSTFAAVAYLTIGSGVEPDVLKSYEHSNLTTTISVSIVFSLFVSYALFNNSIRLSLHNLIFNQILRKKTEMTFKWLAIETAGIVSSTMLIAIFVNDISYFNGAAWAFFGSLIVYIFPTILALRLKMFKEKIWIVITVVTLIYGVAVSLIMGSVMNALDWHESIKREALEKLKSK